MDLFICIRNNVSTSLIFDFAVSRIYNNIKSLVKYEHQNQTTLMYSHTSIILLMIFFNYLKKEM